MMILPDSSGDEYDHEMDIVDDEVDQDEVDQGQNEVNQNQDELDQDADRVINEIGDKRFKGLRIFAKLRLQHMSKEEYPKTEQSFLLTIKKEIAELQNGFVSDQRMESYTEGFKEDWLEAATYIEEKEKQFELKKRSQKTGKEKC